MKFLKKAIMILIVVTASVYPVNRTVGVIHNDLTGAEGYTLFAPMRGRTTYLIDNYGRLVNQWQSLEWNQPDFSVYLDENGNLVKTIATPSGETGIEIMNWDGELIWQFIYYDTSYRLHHDIELLPNGNILAIVRDIKPKSDFEDAGRDPSTISTFRLWSEKIIEFKPVGTNSADIVWEWSVFDHLIQDYDPAKDNYGIVEDHPELVDINYTPNQLWSWLHFNGMDYNSELDQIIVNSRSLSEFWVIDHSTTTQEAAGHTGGNSGKGGDILYRWGNPESYRATLNNTRICYQGHDPKWIPAGYPGEGNITFFNNGESRPGGPYSTVDELIPDVDANGNYTMPSAGDSFLPRDILWRFSGDPAESIYSQLVSGAHRLKNGNTILCEGQSATFYETTPDSNVVWKYISPYLESQKEATQGTTDALSDVFRCTRYASDHAAFTGKTITPKGYVEQNPITVEGTVHAPSSPTDIDQVTVTSKIFDPSGIVSADLYVFFGTDSLIISMNDSGTGGDAAAGDSVYTALVPALPGYEKADYFLSIEDGDGMLFNDPPFGSKDYTFSYDMTDSTPPNLIITEDQDNIMLNWDPVEGVTQFKVYSSADPYSGYQEDTSGSFSGESWTAPTSVLKRFYYVVSVK